MKVDFSNFIKTCITILFLSIGLVSVIAQGASTPAEVGVSRQSASIGYAYEESDLQWSAGESNTVHLNDIIAYNGYSVKVIGFPEPVESNRYSETPSEAVKPFVALNVSKNESFSNNTVLGNNESYITPDGELRVIVTGLPEGNSTEWLYESYNPWATVELDQRGKPDLSVTIDTDKVDYSSSEDTEIVSYITITNSGDGDAVNVDLDINSPFSVKNGSLKNHYDRIKKGESVTEDLTLTMPVINEDTTYDISTNVSGYDVKNIPYPANTTKQISVAVDPQMSMSLQKTTLEKIYLKDSAMVSLDLKNNGKIDIENVTINDSVPTGFTIVGNNSLHWVVDIPAGGDWNYHYIVKPLEPNTEGVVFPVATAEFNVQKELYGIRSNQPKIVVYGPLIIINKTSDVSEFNPGDIVKIIVNAKNTGSTPTRVFIKDKLPENTALISGITNYNDFLEAGKEVNFSYSLKLNSNSAIELQPANAQYYEFGSKGIMINKSSQKVELTIKKPSITANVTTPIITKPPENKVNISSLNITNNTNMTNVTKTNETIFDIISKIIRTLTKIQYVTSLFILRKTMSTDKW